MSEEKRIVLNEDDFKTLVRGEAVRKKGVTISFSFIGFGRMRSIIRRVWLNKKREKYHPV